MKSFKNQPINILVPISGEGRRFSVAGFTKPKPLIKVLDKLMVEWGVSSCDFLGELTDYNLIFTVRKEHVEKFKIDQKLKELFGDTIIVIPIDTDNWPRGQAGHALAAKDYINNDNRLFIYSCDTYSLSPAGALIEAEDPAGILPCFRANEDRFSYAKLDQNNYVCATAEKRVISDLATTGHYYFRHGSDFVAAVESMIQNGETFNNEYYVAPCYNFLIKQGKKIRVVMVTSNWVMGTPSELEYFLAHYPNQ